MNKVEVLFFLPEKTMNEATIYYVDILKLAVENAGYHVVTTKSYSDLKKYKNIFVMSAKWCFIVKMMNPRARVITWFQGLGAEEALMTKNSHIRKILWECVEFFTGKFSWFNIYVSSSMHQHYVKKYKIKNKNYFIMPCFNKELNENAFENEKKYIDPTFVYAGGLDKWQCIEETLALYEIVENRIPNASLTILTKEIALAKEMVAKYDIKRVKIDFISLEKLDTELEKYKYGFLIREDHIVNNVSTPTKMNSYLANGIIPIYTDVVADFDNFSGLDLNAIVLNKNGTLSEWGEAVITHIEKNNLQGDIYMAEVRKIFSQYYNASYYVDSLSKLFIEKSFSRVG